VSKDIYCFIEQYSCLRRDWNGEMGMQSASTEDKGSCRSFQSRKNQQ